MPIVPKGTIVTAVPWKVPEANWELPGDRDWFAPEAWERLMSWHAPGENDVWWQYFSKTTKEDFPFEDSETREWGGAEVTLRNEYLFVFLGRENPSMRNGGWAGFIVLTAEVVTASSQAWRELWNATSAQEDYYRRTILAQRKIMAIKQYRDDHGLCPLRVAKDAIDHLEDIMLNDGTFKP